MTKHTLYTINPELATKPRMIDWMVFESLMATANSFILLSGSEDSTLTTSESDSFTYSVKELRETVETEALTTEQLRDRMKSLLYDMLALME